MFILETFVKSVLKILIVFLLEETTLFSSFVVAEIIL